MIAKNGLNSLRNVYETRRFAVCKDKKYFDKNWQKGKSKSYCDEQLKLGRANGYGIITGEIESLGIVAIDFDGESASIIAKHIGKYGWLLNIDSMAWTSGKKGYYQIAFIIPKSHLPFWRGITKHDISHHKGYNCTNGEHLEIRYNNHASVLPESVHPETDYYKWIKEIVPRELTYQESYDLLNICTAYQKTDLSNDQELNLIQEALSFISPDDYHTWTTIGMALYNHGVDIGCWDNWSSQSAKYQSNNIESKWQSFSKISKVGIGTLFHLAKQNGFDQAQWMRQNLKSNRVALNKTLAKSPDDVAENNINLIFQKTVEKLSSPLIDESQRFLEIGQVCSQYKISPKSLKDAIDARIARDNCQIELESIKADFEDLINVPNEKLDLPHIFGDFMGYALIDIAKGIPTNPDAIITVLLPTLASVIGTQSRIIVNADTRYIVPFIVRSMIVAKTGQKKSPTARIGIEPLQDINIAEYEKFQQKMKEYEESEDDKLPLPVQRKYIIQDSTFDGLIKAHSENPIGFLCYVDELFGYFTRMNKFYNGDDVQRDLELYEGKPLIKTRADSKSDVFLKRTAISITGTIQDVAIQSILSNPKDLTGISARWLIWAGAMPLGFLPDRDKKQDTNFLFYADLVLQFLINYDYNDLLISDEAYEMFRQWQHQIMTSIEKQTLLQVEAKHAKIESDVIKFAGILHYFYIATSQDHLIQNPSVIGIEVMKRAIILGNYYLRHFAYVATRCNGDLLNGTLMKIAELVKRKGTITGIDVKNFIRELKTSPSKEINELMLKLVELGKAELIPTHKGVKIKSL